MEQVEQQNKNLREALTRYSHGETGQADRLLGLLSETTLIAPAIESSGSIKVVTFTYEGKDIVPAFTSQEYYDQWAQDEAYICFPVFGSDLALTLPADVWLFVDPGFETYAWLKPEDVSRLCEIGTSLSSGELSQEKIEKAEAGTQIFSISKFEDVIEQLREVLVSFPEVLEGYFVEAQDEEGHGVLGLLTKELKVEKRFSLIDKIAEVSRLCLGVAGAIEVFDDLNLTSSNSWQLFNTQTPFYISDEGHQN